MIPKTKDPLTRPTVSLNAVKRVSRASDTAERPFTPTRQPINSPKKSERFYAPSTQIERTKAPMVEMSKVTSLGALQPLKRSFPYIINRPKKGRGKVLSPLKDIVLDSNHRLAKNELLFHSKSRENNGSNADSRLSERIDRLFKTSLYDYPTVEREFLRTLNDGLYSSNEGDKAEELDTVVLNRIKELNDAVQFQDRLDRLGDRPFLKHILLSDLETCWNDSPLKIALLSDEEFKALSLRDISELNARQVEMLKERLDEWPASQNTPVADSSLEALTLDQFMNLPDNAVQFKAASLKGQSSQILQIVPNRVLPLLNLSELSKKDLDALSHVCLPNVKSQKNRMHLFSIDQLYQNLEWLNEATIPFISTERLKEWDFKASINSEPIQCIVYKPETGRVLLCRAVTLATVNISANS